MNRKNINIIIFLFYWHIGLFAQQDIHHTQYLNMPVAFNPATNGLFNGAFRFLGNYRTQWNAFGDPFTSMYFNADGSFFKGKISNGFMGGGLQFFNDITGDSRFRSTGSYASFAYHFDLTGGSELSHLSIGFQAGTIQRSLSFLNLTWDNQWNGNNFNQNIDPNEALPTASKTLFDLNAGINWSYQTSDELHIFSAGIATHHINTGDISMRSIQENMDRRWLFHANAEIGFKQSIAAIVPSFIYSLQGPNKYFNFGTELKLKIQERTRITNYRNEFSISFGPYYRSNDALLAMLRIHWAGLVFGFSYDYNVSALKAVTNGYGAMEFTLGFKTAFGANKRPHKVKFL